MCLGNICRSPAAHAVAVQRLAERGLVDAVTVDSAGTGDWHVGQLPHRQSRAAGERRGYIVDHPARQLQRVDGERFDLIVAMDRANLRDIRSVLTPAGDQLVLLRSYDPRGGADAELADPYSKPDAAFEQMYDVIERCIDPLLDDLVARRVVRTP